MNNEREREEERKREKLEEAKKKRDLTWQDDKVANRRARHSLTGRAASEINLIQFKKFSELYTTIKYLHILDEIPFFSLYKSKS